MRRREGSGDGTHAAGSRRSLRADHAQIVKGHLEIDTTNARALQPAGDARHTHMAGFYTLFYKEWLRFWKVSVQTILAPVLTALLYLLVFSHVLEANVSVFGGKVRYTDFLVPGLVMMSILQNAFANSSSSLIQ